jgi:hypothetical protein
MDGMSLRAVPGEDELTTEEVLAEHQPTAAGDRCRACGFVYPDEDKCAAVVLAEDGYAYLADRLTPADDQDQADSGATLEWLETRRAWAEFRSGAPAQSAPLAPGWVVCWRDLAWVGLWALGGTILWSYLPLLRSSGLLHVAAETAVVACAGAALYKSSAFLTDVGFARDESRGRRRAARQVAS